MERFKALMLVARSNALVLTISVIAFAVALVAVVASWPPTTETWGTYAEWVAGIGTAGALIYLARQYHDDEERRRRRADERRLERARGMSLDVQSTQTGDIDVTYEFVMSNDSEQDFFSDVQTVGESIAGTERSKGSLHSLVEPGMAMIETFRLPLERMSPPEMLWWVVYTDEDGFTWKRNTLGQIVRLRTPSS